MSEPTIGEVKIIARLDKVIELLQALVDALKWDRTNPYRPGDATKPIGIGEKWDWSQYRQSERGDWANWKPTDEDMLQHMNAARAVSWVGSRGATNAYVPDKSSES
jgi:hypothetical protein